MTFKCKGEDTAERVKSVNLPSPRILDVHSFCPFIVKFQECQMKRVHDPLPLILPKPPLEIIYEFFREARWIMQVLVVSLPFLLHLAFAFVTIPVKFRLLLGS